MSDQSGGLQKQSLSLPILVGLVILTVSLLYLIANVNWFSTGRPIGMVFQSLIEVLFFFTIFIAPIILVWKTIWPVWFIGLGCGLVSTSLIQLGIHSAPEVAEGIGSLLFVSFIIQSVISAGIALISSFILKKFLKKATRIAVPDKKAVADSSHRP